MVISCPSDGEVLVDSSGTVKLRVLGRQEGRKWSAYLIQLKDIPRDAIELHHTSCPSVKLGDHSDESEWKTWIVVNRPDAQTLDAAGKVLREQGIYSGSQFRLIWSTTSVAKTDSNDAIVTAALGMQGYFNWVQSGPDTSPTGNFKIKCDYGLKIQGFGTWVTKGPAYEPTKNSTMNCWEAVIFSGYKAGIVSYHWIAQMHNEATRAAIDYGKSRRAHWDEIKYPEASRTVEQQQEYYNVIKKYLKFDSAKTFGTGQEPKKGDVVFFNELAHVALSTGVKDAAGHHEVMSLWVVPEVGGMRFTKFQKTTIEELEKSMLAGGINIIQVKFTKNPWSSL